MNDYRREYCKFGFFCENFIFANSIKRHIYDVRNSRLWHDIRISVNDRVILPFHECFIFTKLRKFRENKTLAKISEFTVIGKPHTDENKPMGFPERAFF